MGFEFLGFRRSFFTDKCLGIIPRGLLGGLSSARPLGCQLCESDIAPRQASQSHTELQLLRAEPPTQSIVAQRQAPGEVLVSQVHPDHRRLSRISWPLACIITASSLSPSWQYLVSPEHAGHRRPNRLAPRTPRGPRGKRCILTRLHAFRARSSCIRIMIYVSPSVCHSHVCARDPARSGTAHTIRVHALRVSHRMCNLFYGSPFTTGSMLPFVAFTSRSFQLGLFRFSCPASLLK